MNRCLQLMCVAVVAMLAVNVQAANVFWMGGTGNLTAANYSDGVTTGLSPLETDVLFLGNTGTVTHSVSGFTLFQKIRIGHDLASPGGVGPATLTVNNGAQLNLTVAGGNANASVIIGEGSGTAGSGVDGTLNIDGAGSSVTSMQLVQIGYGDKATANATVNITDGGSLVASAGNINLGERNAVGSGVPGHLNISGAGSSLTITNATADLNVGVQAPSSYVQTDGTVSIGDAIVVGDNAAHGSTFGVSGGSLTSKSISIGPTANNVAASITGNAVINVTTNNFNVGSGTGQGASLLVADNADINILASTSAPAGQGNMFIGRSTSANTAFTMTGGTIDTGRNFLMGSGLGATNIVGNHSGGTITTTLNFVVCDTGGASTYNLSGNGAIVANGVVNVGRQSATGVMNQSGGSVTSALGIAVGNAETATTTLWGTGIYNVSGGTITANQAVSGTALRIAPQGTGTFRVIGDDSTINVNGNAVVSSAVGAQGTLAYQLETGDLLSRINVTGTATFNAGAILAFDTSLASPTQTSYELLTATDVIDSGLVFSGPAGWAFDIIAGGNGEILRAVQSVSPGLLGDFNSDTKVDAGDYATWRKNDGTNNALANDNGLGVPVGPAHYNLWRANFGNPPGAGSGLSGAQVPEPTSLVLVLFGLAAIVGGRHR